MLLTIIIVKNGCILIIELAEIFYICGMGNKADLSGLLGT